MYGSLWFAQWIDKVVRKLSKVSNKCQKSRCMGTAVKALGTFVWDSHEPWPAKPMRMGKNMVAAKACPTEAKGHVENWWELISDLGSGQLCCGRVRRQRQIMWEWDLNLEWTQMLGFLYRPSFLFIFPVLLCYVQKFGNICCKFDLQNALEDVAGWVHGSSLHSVCPSHLASGWQLGTPQVSG